MDYDVIIIGAGPAGIFTALELAQSGITSVLLLEQGKDLTARDRMDARDRLCGWGGAGAFSDGKLTISTEVGGALGEFIEEKTLHDLLIATDETYVRYGAPDRLFGLMTPQLQALSDRASKAGLDFLPCPVRHIGTENCPKVLDRLRQDLSSKIVIKTGQKAQRLLVENGCIRGVELADGRTLASRFVVAAPGRCGAAWMKKEADTLRLCSSSNAVDIGLRVELPAAVFKDITDTAHESKLIYYSKTFDEKVRTFCMNPYGEVVTEAIDEVVTVNGHSYADKKSENTNFAILVSSRFTQPFDDPIAYGLYIARLANLLGGGAIVQRLGDLLAGRRSTPERLARSLVRPTLKNATPGDLSFVFPYRHLLSILEMLQALDRLAPGVYSRHTLLYGVEVKFYSNRIQVSPEMETEIENLFVIGDGAGITRGLLQASASGTLAARAIAKRLKYRA